MALDFRALQIKTSKIISSGSSAGGSKLALYDIAAALDGAGTINTAVFPVTSIGSDVFMFVSGGTGARGVANSNAVSVFGGDLVVSGNVVFLGNMTSGSGTGFVLTNGSTPMTATWAFGNQWLQNVNKLSMQSSTDPGAGNILLPNVGQLLSRDPNNTGNVSLVFQDGANQFNAGSAVSSASLYTAGGSHFFLIGAGTYAVVSTASVIIGTNATDTFSNPGNGTLRAPHVGAGNSNTNAASLLLQPGLGTGTGSVGFVSIYGTLSASAGTTRHTTNEIARAYGTGMVIAGSGGNPTTPHSAALLDMQSTTQGVLFPRMSTTQRNAVPAPVGLSVFDSTLGSFAFRVGVSTPVWVTMNTAVTARDVRVVASNLVTTTNVTGSPQAVSQFQWIPNDHAASGSGFPVALNAILATTLNTTTASLTLFNVTSQVYVTIAGTNVLLSTTSSTPVYLSTSDLYAGNVQNFPSQSQALMELRLQTSNNSNAVILGNAEITVG